ncbi:MAG TPA: class I SAM-dependent methyltransferase [Candidatus Moranbacteria bacterium]|nr:class I SAM-dependent methyltransferase [Candidatus Moranbacteria bacterium]
MKSSTETMRPMNELVVSMMEWIKKKNPQVADFLVGAYNGDDIDPAMLEKTVSFLVANSAIAATVLASPGSSVISELLYDQEDTNSVIDQYFYNSRGGMAVKGRLDAVQKHLPIITERYLKEQSEVIIGSLGSGPGRYMADAISQLRAKGYPNSVKAICFDVDENAVLRGKRIAAIYGVTDAVRFKRADMQGNMVKYYHDKFDILVLKGILCPYDDKGCRTLLEHVRPMLKTGGTIIASNVSKKMVEGDPFTCFIMDNIVNWVMDYKDEAELRSIFEAANINWESSFTDDLGYHIMGVGRVF